MIVKTKKMQVIQKNVYIKGAEGFLRLEGTSKLGDDLRLGCVEQTSDNWKVVFQTTSLCYFYHIKLFDDIDNTKKYHN